MDRTQLNVRIRTDVADHIRRQARLKGVSLGEVVEEAVNAYEEEDWREQIEQRLRRLEEVAGP